jgi:glutamate dehydrogenase (NAD(P)+)
VLIPAALADSSNEKSATGIQAKIVLEGANAPTTPASDAIKKEKNIPVVPDIFANAGAVIVSYIEWVQHKQNYSWTADEVDQNLTDILMKSIREVRAEVRAMSVSKNITRRKAAMMLGVSRVAEAYK